MPMTRGMEAACYVKLAPGASVADLRKALEVGLARAAGAEGAAAELDTATTALLGRRT